MADSKVTHPELRQAVRDLQNRGLLHSARWAAEQLYGLEDECSDNSEDNHSKDGDEGKGKGGREGAEGSSDDEDDAMDLGTPSTGAKGGGGGRKGGKGRGGGGGGASWRGRGKTPEAAGDDFILAKAYFDLGEYRRASHQLSDNTSSLGRFLRYYALYLAGEKRKNEEMLEVGGGALGGHMPGPGGAGAGGAGGPPPGGPGAGGGKGPRPRRDVLNVELASISNDLPLILADETEEARNDPFLHYLHGLVLVEKDLKDQARVALCAACHGYPCNWGAWEALMPLCATVEDAQALPLPAHWMRKWFIAALQLELQDNRKGLQAYASLVTDIPASSIGVVQMAVGHYNMREFDRAQSIFEDVYRADPFRLEEMDTYSNILYVKEASAKLSFLAHSAVLTDKVGRSPGSNAPSAPSLPWRVACVLCAVRCAERSATRRNENASRVTTQESQNLGCG
jgi:anaphase-promoting complex subunit 8